MDVLLKPMYEIKPYLKNPRKNDASVDKVAASIKEFGFKQPIVIDKDGVIIAGHTRYKAAASLGLTTVPVIIADDLSDIQTQAYRLADNKTAEFAEWDFDLLSEELNMLSEFEFDMVPFGFVPEEEIEVVDDDFDVDKELAEPAISKRGDVWHLGRHRLVCGDSTDPETYRVLMDGQKANLVVTDPPYNVNYSAQAGSIQNDNMQDADFYNFLLKAFTNMAECMEKDASIYVFHADTEGYNFRKAFQDAGLHLSGVCIWEKQSLVLGRSPYQWRHEPILFGWRKDGKHNWYADRKQSTIWNFDKPSRNGLHPTMKPIALCAYPIQNSSMSNCIVLDPFGGSGSTLIACEQTNRICFTVELDEKYTDVIVKRYIEQVGSESDVFLERDGQKIPFEDVQKPE